MPYIPSEIFRKSFTKKEVGAWLANPVADIGDGSIQDIVHRVAANVRDNPKNAFASFTDEDLYQECWMGAYVALKKGWYKCDKPLCPFLQTIFNTVMLRLRRKHQLRTDISFQKRCKTCMDRKVCKRKISIGDLDKYHECPVIREAVAREGFKYAASTTADYDMTEPGDEDTDVMRGAIINDILYVFGEHIPDDLVEPFNLLMQGDKIKSKKILIRLRRWTWKILKNAVMDEEEHEEIKRAVERVRDLARWNKIKRKQRKAEKDKKKEVDEFILSNIVPPEEVNNE